MRMKRVQPLFIIITLLMGCATSQKQNADQTQVTDIIFEGNHALDREFLLQGLKVKPGLIADSDLEKLIADDQNLINYYFFNLGYALVKVSGPSIHQIKSDHGKVVFHIQEGERFKVAQVLFLGDLLLSKSNLRKIVTTKSNDFFNYVVFRDDMAAIADKYKALGFPNVKVEPKTIVHEQTATLDIGFVISKGSRVN